VRPGTQRSSPARRSHTYLDEAYGYAAKVHAELQAVIAELHRVQDAVERPGALEDVDDDSELTELLERIGQLHLDACVVCGIHRTHAAPQIVGVEVFDINPTRAPARQAGSHRASLTAEDLTG
jgi:phosphoenolpyruvate carboxylase